MEKLPSLSTSNVENEMTEINRGDFYRRLRILNGKIPYSSFEETHNLIALYSEPENENTLYWYESGLDFLTASKHLGISITDLKNDIDHMAMCIAIGEYSKREY